MSMHTIAMYFEGNPPDLKTMQVFAKCLECGHTWETGLDAMVEGLAGTGDIVCPVCFNSLRDRSAVGKC